MEGRGSLLISIYGDGPDQLEWRVFGEQINIYIAPANWPQTTNTNSIAGA